MRETWRAVLMVALGSVLGGWMLLQIDARILHYIVPILLIGIAVYFLIFSKGLDNNKSPKLSQKSYDISIAPAIGFYDGIFGPGTGTFFSTSFVALRGMALRQATAHAKLLNFISNIASLIYFIFFGQIIWLAGGVMIFGQILGGYFGAKTALKSGAKVIRPVIIVVCIVMSIRLLLHL